MFQRAIQDDFNKNTQTGPATGMTISQKYKITKKKGEKTGHVKLLADRKKGQTGPSKLAEGTQYSSRRNDKVDIETYPDTSKVIYDE